MCCRPTGGRAPTSTPGIDPTTWKPELGVDGNRETGVRVYEYYGQLFRDHPGLEWAGMANLVGPSFAAGFSDLDGLRDLARHFESLPKPVRRVLDPTGKGLSSLANASDDQLRFYETRFLTMQKDIFEDMGASHEAYLSGGMDAVREMDAAELFGPNDQGHTVQAWNFIDRGIDNGSRKDLDDGAMRLARREQFDIIGNNWDAMRDHPPFGDVATYLMTVVGKTSVPGTHYSGQVRPLEVPLGGVAPLLAGPLRLPTCLMTIVPLPGLPSHISVPEPYLRTTLPAINVADRDSRWDFFVADTLPTYQRLLDQPGLVQELTAGDMQQRIDHERALRRVPELLAVNVPWNWHVVWH